VARSTRTADDWARAALEAIAEGGVAAVRVESLAPRVGASKGSFYWHFADRPALVAAALARWEELSTEAIIRDVEAVADPAERLRRLFSRAFGDPRGGRVDAALAADADDPVVGPVLRRVTERRIAFLRAAYADLGLGEREAGSRALAAYAAFLGLFAVRRIVPGDVPAAGEPLDAFLHDLLRALSPQEPRVSGA